MIFSRQIVDYRFESFFSLFVADLINVVSLIKNVLNKSILRIKDEYSVHIILYIIINGVNRTTESRGT